MGEVVLFQEYFSNSSYVWRCGWRTFYLVHFSVFPDFQQLTRITFAIMK